MSPDETPALDEAGRAANEWVATTLDQGNQSAIPELRMTTIRAPQQWEQFWALHASQGLKSTPTPSVDFERDMVLAVVLGPRPNPGYGVEIEELFTEEGCLIVAARETLPDPERMYAQVVCTPFHVVVAPAFDGPVEFRLR